MVEGGSILLLLLLLLCLKKQRTICVRGNAFNSHSHTNIPEDHNAYDNKKEHINLDTDQDNYALCVWQLHLFSFGCIVRRNLEIQIEDGLNLKELVEVSDDDCKNVLRMRIEWRGLNNSKHVSAKDKVDMFLFILAHHTKNRVVKFQFKRPECCNQFLSYIHYSWWNHNLFLSTVLTRVEENSRYIFKILIYFINISISNNYKATKINKDQGRYRNQKGQISVNMLGVCDMNMRFVYVLTGWEGFDVDSRVPRDIINHSNGLRVPRGTYYLCDNGYPNCDGVFNTVQRNGHKILHEYFNMKHTRARNVIEHAFGLLKMRCSILHNPLGIMSRHIIKL
ncbi:hypothetical protein ACS0TY_032206 [Phlomoides rotata]